MALVKVSHSRLSLMRGWWILSGLTPVTNIQSGNLPFLTTIRCPLSSFSSRNRSRYSVTSCSMAAWRRRLAPRRINSSRSDFGVSCPCFFSSMGASFFTGVSFLPCLLKGIYRDVLALNRIRLKFVPSTRFSYNSINISWLTSIKLYLFFS
jgi:hypothetical protein